MLRIMIEIGKVIQYNKFIKRYNGSIIGTVCEGGMKSLSLKTLEKSLELLRCFSEEKPAWGVREIAKELDMSHTIVHRILATFEQFGYLRQNPENKKYELGLEFLQIAQKVKARIHPGDVLVPVMKGLSEQTGESVFLSWLDGLEGVYVEIVESSHVLKYSVTVGRRFPLYAGSIGRVMMAHLPEDKQEEIISRGLNPLTSRTIVNPEVLRQQLQMIRKNGWAYSAGEYNEGVAGLHMPLFDKNGKILGSLGIAGPDHRLAEEKVPELLDHLMKARDEIQQLLNDYSFRYL
ncbi:IclR family transcriptional regulator [Brevibacillus borstelensis]|nr:IclR family transcriptional regulator [Brevibacillus borstelensis]